MNWTQFILGLSAAYFIYYLLNVLFDLLRLKPKPIEDPGQEELTFSEDHRPTIVVADEPQTEDAKQQPAMPNNRQVISSGLLKTTGGVSLKQLFSLAQFDLIEYTKAIPY